MRTALLRFGALMMVLGCVGAQSRAEDLILKSGQKISGTIVGFENGMFRVETEFGLALVRRDKVASVNFSTNRERSAQSHQPGEPSSPKPTESSISTASDKPATAAAKPKAEKTPVSIAGPTAGLPTPEMQPAAPKPESKVLPQTPATPPPPPVSQPVDEPLPARIQGHIEGGNYVNDTFQFAMFKPPDWKVYETLPRESGYGIVAMGTEDERTLLIVDRQVWSGSPDLKNDRVEERLRQNYPEFRKISEMRAEIAGCPARRRAFVAVIDGAEWHGVTVHLARGNTLFGITGLTSAEMTGFEQAVLNKIINSFHFVSPAASVNLPTIRPTIRQSVRTSVRKRT